MLRIEKELKSVEEKFNTGLCPSKMDVFSEIKRVLPEISDNEAMQQTYRIISKIIRG